MNITIDSKYSYLIHYILIFYLLAWLVCLSVYSVMRGISQYNYIISIYFYLFLLI